METPLFKLQLFALNVTVTASNTLVSGTADNDKIQLGGDWKNTVSGVTVEAGAGNDTINNYYGNNAVIYAGDGDDAISAGSDSTVNGGDGNDYIHVDSNSIIISGAGNDTLYFYSGQVFAITDFDVNDVLFVDGDVIGESPKFANFANGVLNVSNMYKVNLPNVTNINNYRNMAVKWNWWDNNGNEITVEKTLGELLDYASYYTSYWKVSGTTATYYADDGSVILTLTGLKSGLKAVDGKIEGIDVDYYHNYYHNITLSKDVLDKKTVSLNIQKVGEFYSLNVEGLNDTVPTAKFENFAWNISGTTATYKAKCTTAGYYCVNNKIKYFAKDAVNTVATITGLKSGTKVNSDGSITGISVEYWNERGDAYGDVTFSDSAPISGKVTVDGDEITFKFSGEDENGNVNLFNNHTVTGSANDDNIGFNGANNIVNTGAGNDYVYEWWYEEPSALITNNNTINTGAGNDNIDVGSSASNKIDSGDGNDIIRAYSSKNTVSAGAGDDFVSFNGSNNYADASAGNDTIFAHSGWDWDEDAQQDVILAISSNTVVAGAGDDLISTTDAAITSAVINAGVGNDTIEMAKVTSSTIDAGEGNDYISVLGDYNWDWEANNWNGELVYGLNANDNTISGGKGDDTIHIGGERNIIQYASGEGNDIIYGYTSDDTLQIAGSYTTQKSGSDLVVKVGSGSMTLKDVSNANIEKVAGDIVWTISGTTATGKIDGKVVATVTGLKKGTKADSLSDSGSVISISKDALGTAAVKLTKGNYTLALANDVEVSVKTPAHWNIDGTTATYRSLDITTGYTVAANGKSISYVSKATVGKDLTTLEGLSENVTADDLTLSGKVVTVKAHALGTDTATISNGYTFKLDTNVTKSVTTKASWAIDDDSAEYTTAHISTGYVLSADKKSVIFNEESGGEMVATIDGLKKNTKANAFSVKNNVITVAKTALNSKNIITMDSEDYTLAIGGGVTKSVTSPEGWYISGTTASYNTEKTSVGYGLFDDGKSIEYISEVDGGDTLVKLTGLKAKTKTTALSIADNVVTISADAINVKTAITATGEDYEFVLGSAAKITAKSKNITLTGSSGNDTLVGSKYADVIQGSDGSDSISGGNGADKLFANGGDTLIGGVGKDSLYSTAGNNTLTGGSGADEFYFTAGNAIITDYTAGTDKIYLQGTSITNSEVSGKNVIFTTSAGTITVKNGKNKNITVDDVTQKYSANISDLWFAEEDNFATASDISDITKSEVIGEVENYSSEKLTTENLITYADK